MLVEIVIPKEYLCGYAELSRVVKQFNCTDYSVQFGQKIVLMIDNRIRTCLVIGSEDIVCGDTPDDTSITRIVQVVVIDKDIEYKYDKNMI